jgi:hypothetical protein
VACRQLGYTGGAALINFNSMFGIYWVYENPIQPIWLDNLRCDSSVHTAVEQCPSNGWGVATCGGSGHWGDVGVNCTKSYNSAGTPCQPFPGYTASPDQNAPGSNLAQYSSLQEAYHACTNSTACLGFNSFYYYTKSSVATPAPKSGVCLYVKNGRILRPAGRHAQAGGSSAVGLFYVRFTQHRVSLCTFSFANATVTATSTATGPLGRKQHRHAPPCRWRF